MTNTGVVSSLSQAPSRPAVNGISGSLAVGQAETRVLARGGCLERLDRLAGRRGQLRRDGHLDGDQQVAAGAVLARDALALDPEGAPVGGALGDPQGDGCPREGRNLDLAAEGRLGERDRHRQGEVVGGAPEQAVRCDGDGDVEISVGAAALARRALALEPDPLPVFHTCRDPDGEGAGAHRPAGAGAVGTRVVDDKPPAAALAARLGEGEATGVAAGLSGALADRAGVRQRAVPPAGAVAGRAGLLAGHPQRHGDALDRLLERQRHRRLDVGAAPGRSRPAGPALAEQPAEHVTETAATGGAAEQVTEVERLPAARGAGAAGRAEPAGPAGAEQRARLVVLLAAGGVGEDVVGLGDLLEPLLGLDPVGAVGVRVGVVLPGQLPVRLLDLVRLGVLGHAERLVVVLLQEVPAAHLGVPLSASRVRDYSGSATATRAGRTTRSPIR